jgi:hypothetical protein
MNMILMGYSAMFITLMLEPLSTSETSVYSNDTARHYIPEGIRLHFICRPIAVCAY